MSGCYLSNRNQGLVAMVFHLQLLFICVTQQASRPSLMENKARAILNTILKRDHVLWKIYCWN